MEEWDALGGKAYVCPHVRMTTLYLGHYPYSITAHSFLSFDFEVFFRLSYTVKYYMSGELPTPVSNLKPLYNHTQQEQRA